MMATRTRRIILVVEDDHDLRVLLRALLEGDGYEVLTAPEGRTALAQLETTTPDLILVDLRMPLMDGWDFVAAVRSIPKLAGIPIGIQTSETDRTPPQGASFILRKPVDARVLLSRLREHLE